MDSNDYGKNTAHSMGYKLVPWVSWDEWNDVRRSIFSPSPNLISAALQKISAWESRGCLPIAVDLTAIIIEIHLKDPFFLHCREDDFIGDVLASEKMLNLLYCMFIMRLVNDFVEPAHKKSGRSISDIADALSIPRTLVDIRHESSHRCLPSLKLARLASVKALEWLKANYWEPQRLAVHDPKEKINSRIREAISCLSSHHALKTSFSKPKRKRKRTAVLAACHKLSHMSERMVASKSDVSTSQMSRVIKRISHLYSQHSAEVVSSLLQYFLSIALDISYKNDKEAIDESVCCILKPITESLTSFKRLITLISNKKPTLLLSMLKVIFEMIYEKESKIFEEDQVCCHVRSLVPFLIRNLIALKESGQIGLVEESQVLSTDNITRPKVLFSALLHKCLTLLTPGDRHMLKSALLLCEMSGNRMLIDRFKKLPFLADPSPDSFHSSCYNKSLLTNIQHRNHEDMDSEYRRSNSDDEMSRWTVTKSWIPCPIGMLPCLFSSAPVVPVFNAVEAEREIGMETNQPKTIDENEMIYAESTEESTEDCSEVEQMIQNEGADSEEPEDPFPLRGLLLIGGMWMKVSEEELASIEEDIRIFV